MGNAYTHKHTLSNRTIFAFIDQGSGAHHGNVARVHWRTALPLSARPVAQCPSHATTANTRTMDNRPGSTAQCVPRVLLGASKRDFKPSLFEGVVVLKRALPPWLAWQPGPICAISPFPPPLNTMTCGWCVCVANRACSFATRPSDRRCGRRRYGQTATFKRSLHTPAASRRRLVVRRRPGQPAPRRCHHHLAAPQPAALAPVARWRIGTVAVAVLAVGHSTHHNPAGQLPPVTSTRGRQYPQRVQCQQWVEGVKRRRRARKAAAEVAVGARTLRSACVTITGGACAVGVAAALARRRPRRCRTSRLR